MTQVNYRHCKILLRKQSVRQFTSLLTTTAKNHCNQNKSKSAFLWVKSELNSPRRPFWVKGKQAEDYCLLENTNKIKKQGKGEAALRCYLHEPLVFRNSPVSKENEEKIKKDLLHYLVLQVKYFQATGYKGWLLYLTIIWRRGYGLPFHNNSNNNNNNNN